MTAPCGRLCSPTNHVSSVSEAVANRGTEGRKKDSRGHRRGNGGHLEGVMQSLQDPHV